MIGRGGFSKVWKVEKKKDRKVLALKEMSKARILLKRSVQSVLNERRLLSQLSNFFLVNMNYAFQDKENLYLLIDYFPGGDLRYHMCKKRPFTEEQTKFFVACLVAALEYIHSKGIIHRDVKPENILFDGDGYLHLTDFGIARVWSPNNASDTSGTPGYMAPEVMSHNNHGVAADYYAIGVIAFECMMGRRPYSGRQRKEIRDQILSKQASIKKEEIPSGWSANSMDFINKMIRRKPLERLGANGPREVKSHPWLVDFPWDKLYNKQLESSFIPNVKADNFDMRNIKENWKDDEELLKKNIQLLEDPAVQNMFSGYYFDISSEIPREVIIESFSQKTTEAKYSFR